MRALLVTSVLVLSACWSEQQFTRDCVAAGHCVVDDAGATGGGSETGGGGGATGGGGGGTLEIVDSGLQPGAFSVSWAQVAAELFDAGVGTVPGVDDAQFTLSVITVFPTTATKWIGGVLGPSGSVYCIPYSSTGALEVLEVLPNDTLRTMAVPGTSWGWEGGVLMPDGTVIGLPNSASDLLIIPTDGGPPRVLDIGLRLLAGSGTFEGGVVTSTGRLWLAPSSSPVAVSWVPGELPRAVTLPSSGLDKAYAGAVLLADGASVLMVPREAASGVVVDGAGVVSSFTLSGYSGGLLLPFNGVMLFPNSSPQRPFMEWRDLNLSPTTKQSSGYFGGAWSTNGFGYALQTDGASGRAVILAPDGELAEPSLGSTEVSSASHYGLVGRPDGSLVACPYASRNVLVFTPNARRTVSLQASSSPWLNHW